MKRINKKSKKQKQEKSGSEHNESGISENVSELSEVWNKQLSCLKELDFEKEREGIREMRPPLFGVPGKPLFPSIAKECFRNGLLDRLIEYVSMNISPVILIDVYIGTKIDYYQEKISGLGGKRTQEEARSILDRISRDHGPSDPDAQFTSEEERKIVRNCSEIRRYEHGMYIIQKQKQRILRCGKAGDQSHVIGALLAELAAESVVMAWEPSAPLEKAVTEHYIKLGEEGLAFEYLSLAPSYGGIDAQVKLLCEVAGTTSTDKMLEILKKRSKEGYDVENMLGIFRKKKKNEITENRIKDISRRTRHNKVIFYCEDNVPLSICEYLESNLEGLLEFHFEEQPERLRTKRPVIYCYCDDKRDFLEMEAYLLRTALGRPSGEFENYESVAIHHYIDDNGDFICDGGALKQFASIIKQYAALGLSSVKV